MIHQIADVKAKTEPLPTINKGLIQARHIQAQLKERSTGGSLPSHVCTWRPLPVGSYLLFVSRWVE